MTVEIGDGVKCEMEDKGSDIRSYNEDVGTTMTMYNKTGSVLTVDTNKSGLSENGGISSNATKAGVINSQKDNTVEEYQAVGAAM